jgi:hypothetical protein
MTHNNLVLIPNWSDRPSPDDSLPVLLQARIEMDNEEESRGRELGRQRQMIQVTRLNYQQDLMGLADS